MSMSTTSSKTAGIDPPVSPVDGRDTTSSYHSTAAVVVQDQAICSAEQRNESSSRSSRLTLTAANSDYLVSEHEDNDGGDGSKGYRTGGSRRITSESGAEIIDAGDDDEDEDDRGSEGSGPAEIPPETDADVDKAYEHKEEDDDDESEYSYDYEDDEDGQYSGFLVSSEPAYDSNSIHGAAVVEDAPEAVKKNIVEDEDAKDGNHDIVQFASLDHSDPTAQKSKWKEPTQAAVSMSLRAEREKSGGRRRLASDLYKVMMTDTEEAGFSVEQSEEECMDKWTVRLFKFDEDSDLHKDLLVLGLDHVELQMNFPEQVRYTL